MPCQAMSCRAAHAYPALAPAWRCQPLTLPLPLRCPLVLPPLAVLQLYDYLKSRMMAVAPNLTVLVGELVGARLIAHVGSLVNLAKAPASTIQILGAEKALFRCAACLLVWVGWLAGRVCGLWSVPVSRSFIWAGW